MATSGHPPEGPKPMLVLVQIADEYGPTIITRPTSWQRVLDKHGLRPKDVTNEQYARAWQLVLRREHEERHQRFEDMRLCNADPTTRMFCVEVGNSDLDPDLNNDYLAAVHPDKWPAVLAEYPHLSHFQPPPYQRLGAVEKPLAGPDPAGAGKTDPRPLPGLANGIPEKAPPAKKVRARAGAGSIV